MTHPRVFVLSAGIRRIPALQALLDDYHLMFKKTAEHRLGDYVLAWGLRPSAERARQYAARHKLGLLHIEDGFLRSVGLGQQDPPLSVILDDQGLYLDASRPSRLESLIGQPLNVQQRERARALTAAWRDGRVSKYNHARDADKNLPCDYVLVADQTRGDASIRCGAADASSFQRMLACSLEEYPDSTILLKLHPDVVSGRKQGHFDIQQLRAHPRVRLLDYDVHPSSLLQSARAVYCVTSQIGFEALIWGKPVRVFGMPFYAGWGLTHDESVAPERRGSATLENLVDAALIRYSRYVDPETGKRCEVETVLAWVALQRRMRQRFEPQITAVGFSAWKKPFVRDFFNGSEVRFVRGAHGISPDSGIAVWGRKHDAVIASRFENSRIVRLEDGFIRSVGLGADLIRPLSWVQDDVGIYYDATCMSRLEHLLLHSAFDEALQARAAALRQAILSRGITKYNLTGVSIWRRPDTVNKVILVPGQVETDASIHYGTSGIRRNIDLLREVRRQNPGAYLLYKPHPDVQAGLRLSGEKESEAKKWCDELIGDAAFHQLLSEVDEVHVLTSLAGFEALLRRVPVITYGQPFYAGWGLTRDICLADAVQRRRSRRLTLDELVAATLILYPTYVSRITRRFTTPEQILRELEEWRFEQEAPFPTKRWRRWVARLFRKP
ncbi:capsular polysaccharide biosynthesis protein [Bordetella petrii]|nr:capsular polysaccharide biosynthesis protein [Bordetella petrii]